MAKTSYYTVDGQIIGERTGGVRTNYAVDALGSVTGTIEDSAIENSYAYKPHGALLQKAGTGPDPIFKWVGAMGYKATGRASAETYIRARTYSTTGSRWTTVDPLWPEELPYPYAQVNPLTIVDPHGMSAQRKQWPHLPPGWLLKQLGAIAKELRELGGAAVDASTTTWGKLSSSISVASELGNAYGLTPCAPRGAACRRMCDKISTRQFGSGLVTDCWQCCIAIHGPTQKGNACRAPCQHFNTGTDIGAPCACGGFFPALPGAIK